MQDGIQTRCIVIEDPHEPTAADLDNIKMAGQVIKDGGLCAFPTETVYGLGGDALNPASSGKIYAAKGRPSDNPLIVHIADIKDIEKIAEDIPDAAYILAERFWPGPLTMILKGNGAVPPATTGGLSTVAVRYPSDKVAAALIRAAGGFVAAPSANTSGRPSTTTAAHVLEDLSGRVDVIIDGGDVDIGLESTIVDLTESTPAILRPGYITLDMIKTVLPDAYYDPAIIDPDSGEAPKAPGMKYRHYAPKGKLTIVKGEKEAVARYIAGLAVQKRQEGAGVGLMVSAENRECFDESVFSVVKTVGEERDDGTIAHNLFAVLREFDEAGVEYIFSESFDGGRLSDAITNRLLKAAGYDVIEV